MIMRSFPVFALISAAVLNGVSGETRDYEYQRVAILLPRVVESGGLRLFVSDSFIFCVVA